MKVVLYNTSKQQDRILRDWIAYPTKAGYFAERKESVLLHASRDQLPQFLFLYSDEMEMISFYFLFGTDNYHRGIVPFIALTDFDELDLIETDNYGELDTSGTMYNRNFPRTL